MDSDADGVYLEAKRDQRIYLKGDLAKRMRPHAQTLNTSIGMGDGVIMCGEVRQDAKGKLWFTPSRADVWYLMRPHQPAGNPEEPRVKDGIAYRVLGIQTPATSMNDADTGLPAYGHLEVHVYADLSKLELGSDRAFVRGTAVKSAKELAFTQRHQRIRIKGAEFSGPINTGMEGLVQQYGEPAWQRVPPAKSKAPRAAK